MKGDSTLGYLLVPFKECTFGYLSHKCKNHQLDCLSTTFFVATSFFFIFHYYFITIVFYRFDLVVTHENMIHDDIEISKFPTVIIKRIFIIIDEI